MQFPRFLLCLLLLLGSLRADTSWLRIQTDNFEIYTPQGERKAKEILLYFEQLREFFLNYWKLKPDPGTPVRIVFFGNEKLYTPFRPHKAAAGFFQHGMDRDWIVIGQQTQGWERLVCHEYTHLMVKQSGLPIPLWLNEGLAEIYSTFRPVGNKVEIGNLIGGHFEAVRHGWIPLSRLIEIHHGDPEYSGKQTAQFYAQSWGLTHMLMLEREHRAVYAKVLEQLVKGTPAHEAFQQAGLTPEQLDRDLSLYLRRNDEFYAGVIPFQSQRSTAAWKSTRVSNVEVDAVLALLQLHSPRSQSDAEARLAALPAGERHTEEALAYAAWRRHDMAAARQHFAQAIALGADNAKVFYDAARASLHSGNKDEASIQYLKKALELYPTWTEARLQLLDHYVLMARYAEALNLATSFKSISPSLASRLFRAISYTEAMLKSLPRARQSQQRARQFARNDFDQLECDKLDNFIAQMDAAGSDADTLRTFLAQQMRDAQLRAEAQAATGYGLPQELEPFEQTEAPVIKRNNLTPSAPTVDPFIPANTRKLEAVLEHMDCSLEHPRLRLRLPDDSTVEVRILDPTRVNLQIVGTPKETQYLDLQCGPQSHKVQITYLLPAADGQPGELIGIGFL